MPNCKLCLEEKTLCKSHIIPEFMFSGIYDETPKRFYSIRQDGERFKSRIEQKGIREYLLCKDCESKLSKYEKYADESIYGKNQRSEVHLVNQAVTDDKRIFLYEFENFDYSLMKLFLDSLLWRVIVSTTMKTSKYSDVIMEKLRVSLFEEKPLKPMEFACLIQAIMNGPGEIIKGFITSPIEKEVLGNKLLSIQIGGFEYNFHMLGAPPKDPIDPILQESGQLKIIGRLLKDMPQFIQLVKPRMDHLNERMESDKKTKK